MLLLNLTRLALAMTLGASHPPAVSTSASVGADPDPVLLTVDILRQMMAFWGNFMHEPDSVRAAGRQSANREPIAFMADTGTGTPQQMQFPSVVKMTAMAASFPSIAADLQQAHLTAAQWEQYRLALFAARLTEQLTPATAATPAHPSATAQNVAFLRAHPQDVEALIGSGMWFPPATTLAATGRPAPQIAVRQWLNNPADTRTTFGDGHVYVLFFTATWCGPCQEVYPVLDTLLKTSSAGAHGLRAVYGTGAFDASGQQSTDSPAQQLETFKEYFGEHQVKSPVAIFADVNQMFGSGYFQGNSMSMPTVVVIDGSGVIQDMMNGWGDDHTQQLTADVAKLTASSH